MQTTTLDISHDQMGFASGHFTIFSATEREKLHGHNFTVRLSITGLVDNNGLLGNYSTYRKQMIELCRPLHERFLLPDRSPYLTLTHKDGYVIATYDGLDMPFPEGDVCVLPISNVSVEELARHLCETFVNNCGIRERDDVTRLVMYVYSKPGQSGTFEFINRER
jgi:6-pyruvoyltetrahydropterin/6-carboxytetrahydropterin synthase